MATSQAKVDFENLYASHTQCVTLKSEFDDTPDHVREIEWGDGGINDAMHDFGTNWDYHRDVLTDKIEEVGEKIEGAIDAWSKVDEQVAGWLTQKERGEQ